MQKKKKKILCGFLRISIFLSFFRRSGNVNTRNRETSFGILITSSSIYCIYIPPKNQYLVLKNDFRIIISHNWRPENFPRITSDRRTYRCCLLNINSNFSLHCIIDSQTFIYDVSKKVFPCLFHYLWYFFFFFKIVQNGYLSISRQENSILIKKIAAQKKEE